ncbi:DNA-binding protein [Shewanella subflava]|uniref:DNA-binding protein n=1 Tax=Shewanella subflava TaxID=2986476 RepID=A0ABT3I5B3_9GAMM|nr:DNA-binding protein [Shewanella subflava]MCW3171247.1 DNA-binding protein [Shewanella subflava]
MSRYVYQIAAPFVSYEEYARLTGVPVATVRNLVRTGRLPIRAKAVPQEKPFINMLALIKEADEQSAA